MVLTIATATTVAPAETMTTVIGKLCAYNARVRRHRSTASDEMSMPESQPHEMRTSNYSLGGDKYQLPIKCEFVAAK